MGARFGDAREAMEGLSRLLGGSGDELTREARGYFRVGAALLFEVVELEGRVELVAADPPAEPGGGDLLAIAALPELAAAIDDGAAVRLSGGEAGALAGALAGRPADRSVLLLPMRPGGEVRYVLALTDPGEQGFSTEEAELAEAFVSAATAGLMQLERAAGQAAQTERQAALARAARTLNDTLDLNQVLVKICEESARILGAEVSAVYMGNEREGLRVEAALGLPAHAIGGRLEPGEGLAGQAVAESRPLMTNDYRGLDQRPRDPMHEAIRSGLAVPMHWDGQLRGALTAGFTRTKLVTADELGLLGTFAEIAAAACRNASAHADLAVAARTDALTGCLNHAAFHASLRLELERTRRTGGRLSLAMLDLDQFKQVNELHGHLAGDEVLRAVGQALRDQVRAYDPVARYGGDEFALIALDAGEAAAAELAERALAALAGVEHAVATAGVAQWNPGETATELIERADRALRFAKHEGERATAQRDSLVPAASPALRRP
jgi:diguanylate cyclase (GGDEF)-like protein